MQASPGCKATIPRDRLQDRLRNRLAQGVQQAIDQLARFWMLNFHDLDVRICHRWYPIQQHVQLRKRHRIEELIAKLSPSLWLTCEVHGFHQALEVQHTLRHIREFHIIDVQGGLLDLLTLLHARNHCALLPLL